MDPGSERSAATAVKVKNRKRTDLLSWSPGRRKRPLENHVRKRGHCCFIRTRPRPDGEKKSDADRKHRLAATPVTIRQMRSLPEPLSAK